jgi:hemerythrin-like domain-containing protein
MEKQTNSSAGQKTDAITLLTSDHAAVKKLFKGYRALVEEEADEPEREQLAKQICRELSVHAQIEEEIFYPAVREELDDDDLMDEAIVEHASAKDLIAQIEGMSAGDELFDAKVIVLGEYIDHHVKEEQDEMFPQARKKKGIDLDALGAELEKRKKELLKTSSKATSRSVRLEREAPRPR